MKQNILRKKINIYLPKTIEFSELITQLIAEDIRNINNPRIMLTGGNSIRQLYRYWNRKNCWNEEVYDYFFTDERCVPKDNILSNYNMTMKNLFLNIDTNNLHINRIEGDASDIEKECLRYAKLIESGIDLLLLSVGEDGHIASIFPNSTLVNEKQDFVSFDLDSNGLGRISITPKAINLCKYKYLIALGEKKGRILFNALQKIDDCNSYPVNLLDDVNWILDTEAEEAINLSLLHKNDLNLCVNYV